MRIKDKRILGKVEYMIMKVVWGRGEATSRDVLRVFSKRREVAYTTIMTMMRQLEQKGFLKHREENRTYVYKPLIPQEEVEKSMLRDFISHVFEGSYRNLVNALYKHEDVSREELMDLVSGLGISDDLKEE